MNSSEPRSPKEHHLVSGVLLRRFCDSRHLLSAFSVPHRTIRVTGPDGVCWAANINPQDPKAFEDLWKSTEDRIPEAFAAIEAGTILGDERLLDLLRDFLAIHLARSKTLVRMYELALPRHLETLENAFRDDPLLPLIFRERHGGLWPAGPDALAATAAEMQERLREMFEDSPFLPERFIANYERAKAFVSEQAVEIGVAQEGEFLIGDAPAQSIRAGHAGVGPLGGVRWNEATTLVMPLGRRHTLSLGKTPAYLEMDRDTVDVLNRVQVIAAQDHVMWNPSADFRQFVSEILDEPPGREEP